jgi:hypothetical protein
MRGTLTAIALAIAVLPGAAAAQTSTLPPVTTPLPPIALPLPPIGLPLPPLGLTAPPSPTPPDSGRLNYPRFVYVVPFDYWQYRYPGMATSPPAREDRKEEPRSGTLRFDVQPEKLLQVFINGYFVGTPEDFDSELELPLGTHAVELIAPGYETVKFEVKIDGTRPITYRGELKPLEVKPATEVVPAPVPPSTLYYIPGCYLGNVDPATVTLPANCDMSKLVKKPSGAPR